jgi:hypothetical protein
VQQVHDFNPGISSNGLFWLVQVPDDAVRITGDTVTISLTNVAVVDQFQFPGGAGQNLGIAGVPATVSFAITYRKVGTPRVVQPRSADPLSPFNWAGEMWMATNSGRFSVAYNDGSFSARGSFSSSGNFGELGTERNGSFVEDQQGAAGAALRLFGQNASNLVAGHAHDRAIRLALSPALKGRVPLQPLIH